MALPPETRRVEVQTAPDGASLYVDGHLVPGTTPTTVALTVDDFHELRAERDGYETLVRAIKPEDHDPVGDAWPLRPSAGRAARSSSRRRTWPRCGSTACPPA